MINYSIDKGHIHGDSIYGLISEGTSTFQEDTTRIPVASRFIYITNIRDNVEAGSLIFYNEKTGETNPVTDEIYFDRKPGRVAISLTKINSGGSGWVLLGGLYKFENVEGSYYEGSTVYFKNAKITAKESDYSLIGSHFLDSNGLAFIKD